MHPAMLPREMERFEIEEIVAQDTHGVVFRARIISSGTPVATRRFFPFGKEGEGLMKEEGIAFGIAASRLANLNHPALRGVRGTHRRHFSGVAVGSDA